METSKKFFHKIVLSKQPKSLLLLCNYHIFFLRKGWRWVHPTCHYHINDSISYENQITCQSMVNLVAFAEIITVSWDYELAMIYSSHIVYNFNQSPRHPRARPVEWQFGPSSPALVACAHGPHCQERWYVGPCFELSFSELSLHLFWVLERVASDLWSWKNSNIKDMARQDIKPMIINYLHYI